MIRQIRVYRATGDSLSCWFSPEGGLSTARLTVTESAHDVTAYLPGLTASNAVAYLTDLGYAERLCPTLIARAQKANEVLVEFQLCIESVVARDNQLAMSIIRDDARILACPVQQFVIVLSLSSKSSDVLSCHEDIQERNLARAIASRIIL